MSLKEQTPIKIQATQSLLHLHCICGWSLALKMAEVPSPTYFQWINSTFMRHCFVVRSYYTLINVYL